MYNTLIRLGLTLKKAQFALAMHIGCPTGVGPATEANTERGVGSLGRMARWYQARWLSRYLVATPRRLRRKVLSRSWRLLTVFRYSSPRRRSPAFWSSGWWVRPRAPAQGGKNGAPSVTRSASGWIEVPRWTLIVAALVSGMTRVNVVPLRSAHRSKGDQDRHLRLREAALLGDATALARLGVEPPSSFAAGQDIGFVCLDDAFEFDGAGLDRRQKTMPPAERGGVRHPAAPLGRAGSTRHRRAAHRLACQSAHKRDPRSACNSAPR